MRQREDASRAETVNSGQDLPIFRLSHFPLRLLRDGIPRVSLPGRRGNLSPVALPNRVVRWRRPRAFSCLSICVVRLPFRRLRLFPPWGKDADASSAACRRHLVGLGPKAGGGGSRLVGSDEPPKAQAVGATQNDNEDDSARCNEQDRLHLQYAVHQPLRRVPALSKCARVCDRHDVTLSKRAGWRTEAQ